jgi:hypothetical protein
MVATVAAIGGAGCGSDDDKAATTTAAPAASAATTTSAATATSSATGPTGDAANPAPVQIDIMVGTDSGPDRVEHIPLGADVTLSITDPNADEEYHVHGYELGDGVEVPKGQTQVFSFTADKAGRFEVESHATETALVVLDVG